MMSFDMNNPEFNDDISDAIREATSEENLTRMVVISQAESGDLESQSALGTCYYHGLWSFEQNYKESAKWFAKAAAKGDVISQFYMGVCYCNGQGVDKNYSKSVEWFSKASDNNMDDAKEHLKNFKENSAGEWEYTGKEIVLNIDDVEDDDDE